MGELVRLPELERRLVAEAFAAVERGDFDAEPVDAVMRGRAGSAAERLQLLERIALIAKAMRACGRPL